MIKDSKFLSWNPPVLNGFKVHVYVTTLLYAFVGKQGKRILTLLRILTVVGMPPH